MQKTNVSSHGNGSPPTRRHLLLPETLIGRRWSIVCNGSCGWRRRA